MTTELFIGSLMILTLAAIIIVALTTDNRVSRSNGTDRNEKLKRSEHDR